MATLKVRLRVNSGRVGTPLYKLGKISEQVERFLRALAADCDVETKSNQWLALDFKNGSVEYDAVYQGDVSFGAAQYFARSLEFLADYNAAGEGLNGIVKTETALEFAKLGALIDPDEDIGLGIYPDRGGAPTWRRVTYAKAAGIRRELEQPLPTYGAVQGILHAWFKEAKEPSFQLRELSTDALIRVLYKPPLYADVARAVQERTTMLIISGDMLYDRATRSAIEMRAEKIDRQAMVSNGEFEAFFGSAPSFEAADQAFG